MGKNRVPSENFSEMRRLAEEKLRNGAQEMPEFSASPDEMQRLIHELAVHQIELEMQQEELLQSREELEEGLERLTELYDFAPLAYLALARDGTILQVNLTGTKLLGVERSRLVHDRFGRFIKAEDLADFTALLDRVFSSNTPAFCEVMLRNDETSSSSADHVLAPNTETLPDRTVRIDAVVSLDGQECRAMLLDISRQKPIEKEPAREDKGGDKMNLSGGA
jgi:PAS domain-containing protein